MADIDDSLATGIGFADKLVIADILPVNFELNF
jgi:hypothetical protein